MNERDRPGPPAARLRVFGRYAVVAFGAAALLAAVVGIASDGTGVVWPMAALAWATQLAAFGLLIAVHGRERFVLGWGVGVIFRFAVLGASLVWVAVADPGRPALRLLSLVGILFALVLLEPVFLRQER